MAAQTPEVPIIRWKFIGDSILSNEKLRHPTYRLKVPGGWLVVVLTGQGSSPTFVPDPEHKWDI